MIFKREIASEDLFNEMLPFLKMHHDEVGHFKEEELAPDFQRYIALDAIGALRIFTARNEENSLVGYNVFFVQKHIHHYSALHASQDVIFIPPEKRGFGPSFIKWCDQQLENEGVKFIYQFVKAKNNYGKVLERQGYQLVDLAYGKVLKGN